MQPATTVQYGKGATYKQVWWAWGVILRYKGGLAAKYTPTYAKEPARGKSMKARRGR
jgi:hypothetical protein